MNAKALAFLPLIFLGAGAAPQGDCGSGAPGSPALPTPIDLAGRPTAPVGLTGQVYAALPTAAPVQGCLSPLPSAAQPGTLRSDSDDVLHGLPAPEILRPLNQPRQAPLIAR